MYNATLYFKKALDCAVLEAAETDDPTDFAEIMKIIGHIKLAIYALERLEEQDANK